MTTLSSPRSLRLACLLSLTFMGAACSGGGGSGGSSGPGASPAGSLGALTSAQVVVSTNPGSGITTPEAVGAGGFLGASIVARDSARNLMYVVEADRNLLLRVDGRGTISVRGPLDATNLPNSLTFDSASGMLYGIRDSGRNRSNRLVRIDPSNAKLEFIGSTIGVSGLAMDVAQNRLLGVTSTGSLYSIDPADGNGTFLFSHLSFSSLRGLAFDPMTRLLYGVDDSPRASLLSFDLGTQDLTLAAVLDRGLQDVCLDEDTGRFFALSGGGQLAEILRTQGTQQASLNALVTFGRQLAGFSFDPRDGRFFAVDARNQELVKFDPNTRLSSQAVRLSIDSGTGLARNVGSLAYDSQINQLYGIDLRTGEFIRVDQQSGQCTDVGFQPGISTRLAIDVLGGRIFGYNASSDVLLDLDPDTPGFSIIDNQLGLTNTRDLAWEPMQRRLVFLAEKSNGDPAVFSYEIQGPLPTPEVDAPAGLSGFGLNQRNGLFYGFAAGQPLYEFDLDLSNDTSSVPSSVRSIDGIWRANWQAALSVQSLGIVFAIDDQRLYEYDVRARSMRFLGSLPTGLQVTDLLYDEQQARVGLRAADRVHWVSPSAPFFSSTSSGIAPSSLLRLAAHPSTNRIFGVDGGLLVRVSLDSTLLTPITQNARPNFSPTAACYVPSQNAVFAVGTETRRGEQLLVRFDVETGDWTDLEASGYLINALFAN